MKRIVRIRGTGKKGIVVKRLPHGLSLVEEQQSNQTRVHRDVDLKDTQKLE